ncbi:MAG: glycosyltransferase [Actinomycetota bacterium]|nr:glycosyltransferase [Actinomycetota bacterium]
MSVVLVAVDRPDGLRLPLGSVLRQCYPAWELLVVETGEGPAPAPSCSDPRIRVLHAPGASRRSGRLRGIEASTGTLVAHLDESSQLDPDWLASVVASLVEAPAELLVGRSPRGAGPGGEQDLSAVVHLRDIPLELVEDWVAGRPLDLLLRGICVRYLDLATSSRQGCDRPSGTPVPGSVPVIDLTGEAPTPFALAVR